MMSEWHVTPDYITNNWTNELLDLMIGKRNERIGQLNQPRKSGNVSEDVLFSKASKLIKVVKK